MSETKKSSIIQFAFDDFEIAITPYHNTAMVIVHNGIKGCGTIISTENLDGQIEANLMIGLDEDMLNLLAIQLAKQIASQSIVFVFSFRPEVLNSFEKIKDFLKKFVDNFPKQK